MPERLLIFKWQLYPGTSFVFMTDRVKKACVNEQKIHVIDIFGKKITGLLFPFQYLRFMEFR